MLLPLIRPEYRDTSGFTSSSHSNRRNIRPSPPNSQSRPTSVPKFPRSGTYRLVFTMLDPINSSSLVSVFAPFTDSSSEASDRKSIDPFWSSILFPEPQRVIYLCHVGFTEAIPILYIHTHYAGWVGMRGVEIVGNSAVFIYCTYIYI